MTEFNQTVNVSGKGIVNISADTIINKVWCSGCKDYLDNANFYKTKYTKNGFTYKCKKCISKDRKEIRKKKKLGIYISKVRKLRLTDKERIIRKIKIKKYQKIYRKENAEILKKKKQEYTLRIKQEGINAYGGKCTCCGENIIEFLTLEHKNGRRKGNKRLTGKKMWAKAKAEGYPDKYTVLCFNCNCAKGAFGFCPHELKEKGK